MCPYWGLKPATLVLSGYLARAQGLIFMSTIHTSSLKLTAADLKCNSSSQTGQVSAQPIEILVGNSWSGSDAEASPKVLMIDDSLVNHVDGTPACPFGH